MPPSDPTDALLPNSRALSKVRLAVAPGCETYGEIKIDEPVSYPDDEDHVVLDLATNCNVIYHRLCRSSSIVVRCRCWSKVQNAVEPSLVFKTSLIQMTKTRWRT